MSNLSIAEINAQMAAKRQRLKDNPEILRKAEKGSAISLGKSDIVPTAVAEQIYKKCWGENRSNVDYYKSLAEQFGVKYYSVLEISHNNYNTLIITDKEHQQNLNEWKNSYGYCIEVRSPGNDLLDYYDKQNETRGQSVKLLVPPSIIFEIRFNKDYLSTKDIYNIAKPYYDNNPSTDSDWSYYKMLRKTRLNWLVNSPSTRKYYFSESDVIDYVKLQTGAKSTKNILHSKSCLAWHGALGGWSFVRVSPATKLPI